MYRTLILRSQQLFEIFVLDAAKSVIGNYLVPGEFSQPFHFLQISHVKNNYFPFLSIRHTAMITKCLAIYLLLNLFAALQFHFSQETNYGHSPTGF